MDGSLVHKLSRLWRFGLKPASPAAFGFAGLCVAAATLACLIIQSIKPGIITQATYYPAILLATLIGGAWAGSLALVLGGLLCWLVFEHPQFGLGALSSAYAITLAIYVASSSAIIWAAEKYRTVVRRLNQEEHYRRLVVDELGHRLKNKLSIVYAILSYELRENRDIREKVDGRFRTLVATDDFITRSDEECASIIDILKMEFAPYDVDRVSLMGEAIQLPSQLAVTLALILHELATNAAKYGALSAACGRVSVSWVTAQGRMTIDWEESGGPPATAPFRQGFGKRLLERGLDPFHGRVEIKFGPGGLVCRITLALPDHQPLQSPLPRRDVTGEESTAVQY